MLGRLQHFDDAERARAAGERSVSLRMLSMKCSAARASGSAAAGSSRRRAARWRIGMIAAALASPLPFARSMA